MVLTTRGDLETLVWVPFPDGTLEGVKYSEDRISLTLVSETSDLLDLSLGLKRHGPTHQSPFNEIESPGSQGSTHVPSHRTIHPFSNLKCSVEDPKLWTEKVND